MPPLARELGAQLDAPPDDETPATPPATKVAVRAGRGGGAGGASASAEASPSALVSRIESLKLEQRDMIERTVRMFEQNNRELLDLKAEVEETSRRNAELREQLAVRDEYASQQRKLEEKRAKLKIPPEGSFMSRADFAKLLASENLITLRDGASHEGQHVFHIIAAANGGPDHTDNYLYALGGSFNIAIGDHLDGFNCYLAGKEKARRAVNVALRVANDESLHRHVEQRGGRGKARTLFTQSWRHKALLERHPNDGDAIAEAMYAQGETLTREVRAAAREERRALREAA